METKIGHIECHNCDKSMHRKYTYCGWCGEVL
jgi:hypothetical protein